MAIVCSNCEVAPAAGAASGASCTACGEPLITVDTGDELVGTRIDNRFEVLAPLGRGGMGVVYRARQLSIGREIAIKVLDRRIEKDVAAVKRFFREAKLASTLAHPNTVPVIDFGQNSDGRLFLAMELVKGKTLLAEMNTAGAMSIPRLAAIGVQLCDALEVAHDLQIVHRDLKLENVMLLEGKRDHVKILDFGLARSLVDPTTQMTATGLISGTPRYMAPEVGIDAAPPAASQDMYSVGVILAELSIGHALWVEPTIEMLFTKKLETEASVADVPLRLRPLVTSLLSNEPSERPTASQTRQLLRDLELSASTLQIELDDDPPSVLGGAKLAPASHDPTINDIQVADPFAKLDVVGLDELEGGPAAKSAKSIQVLLPSASPPLDGHATDLTIDQRFMGPSTDGPPVELAVDRGYVAERSIKLAARRAEQVGVVKKKSGSAAGLMVALLFAGLIGVGFYVFYTYKRNHDNQIGGGGITIVITAEVKHEVQIDGHKAGITPLRLQMAKSNKVVMITAEGLAPQQVVADHDQTVRLVP